MQTSYEHREEFSVDEYASIGRLVRSLANLEYQIGAATLRLLGAPVFEEATTETLAGRVIKSPLKGRIQLFFETYQAKFGNDTWLATFAQEVSELAKWRDGVCHGMWSRGEDNEMKLVFYDRLSFEQQIDIPVQTLTAQETNRMSNAANFWSWTLHERFSPEKA